MQVTPRLLQVVRRPEEVRTPGTLFEGVRSLLIVRHDRIGDFVLSLPAVAALRQAYREARIALMVRPDLVPLARMVPVGDEVRAAHADPTRLRREIAQLGPDLVVCISRGVAIARAAATARVRVRVGTGYRIYAPLFTRTVRERRRVGGRHELEYALSFAHRAGAPAGPASFPLVPSAAARASAAEWLAAQGVAGPFAVLHPGSGGSCPRWPVGHFVELAARLRAAQWPVVFSLGPADTGCEEALEAAPPGVRGLPRHRGSIVRLLATLQSAALVVSNSTGPLHIAAALGTPTLGIYAPWATCGAARWGPYAPNGWALEADSSAARRWSRRERRRWGERLLAAIEPAEAACCAEALLDGRVPRVEGRSVAGS